VIAWATEPPRPRPSTRGTSVASAARTSVASNTRPVHSIVAWPRCEVTTRPYGPTPHQWVRCVTSSYRAGQDGAQPGGGDHRAPGRGVRRVRGIKPRQVSDLAAGTTVGGGGGPGGFGRCPVVAYAFPRRQRKPGTAPRGLARHLTRGWGDLYVEAAPQATWWGGRFAVARSGPGLGEEGGCAGARAWSEPRPRPTRSTFFCHKQRKIERIRDFAPPPPTRSAFCCINQHKVERVRIRSRRARGAGPRAGRPVGTRRPALGAVPDGPRPGPKPSGPDAPPHPAPTSTTAARSALARAASITSSPTIASESATGGGAPPRIAATIPS
jgi:hypothetical protein